MIPKVKYYGPQIPSTYAVNMTAAASGSNGITVADDDDIDFGTGDFFIHWEGSLPDWTPSAAVNYLYYHYADANNRIGLYVNSSGNLVFFAVIGGVRVCAETTATTISTSTAHVSGIDGAIYEISCKFARETASAAGSISYFVNGAQLGSSIAVSAASPPSFTIAGTAYVSGTNAVRVASNTISCIVGNFAPTASEVLDLCTNGIPASWKWGSQTNIGPTNGDFETWTVPTNPNTWSEGSNVSASVSQVTGGSQYAGTYSLQFTGAGLPSSTFNNTIFQSNFWSNPVLGKKYRIRVAAKRTSGSGDLYIGQGGTEFSSISTASGLSTSWALFTIEKTITSNAGNASSFVIAGASGSVFQVDAITVEQIGATMALLPDTIPTSSATTWSDTSGNTGGGTLPAAGATKVTIRK